MRAAAGAAFCAPLSHAALFASLLLRSETLAYMAAWHQKSAA